MGKDIVYIKSGESRGVIAEVMASNSVTTTIQFGVESGSGVQGEPTNNLLLLKRGQRLRLMKNCVPKSKGDEGIVGWGIFPYAWACIVTFDDGYQLTVPFDRIIRINPRPRATDTRA